MTLEYYLAPKVLRRKLNDPIWTLFPLINVDYIKDIPCDYCGGMAVPITIMNKFNSEQFEIISCGSGTLENGRKPYKRFVVRNKTPKLGSYTVTVKISDDYQKTSKVEDTEQLSLLEG